MAKSSLLLLVSLAVSVQSWPQQPTIPNHARELTAFPVIDAVHVSARSLQTENEVQQAGIPAVRERSKRTPQGGNEEDRPWHILPISQRSKRAASAQQEEDRPWHILPIEIKRSLPVDDLPGGMTLPVAQKSKREAQNEDGEERPWHILPINSKRSLPVDDLPGGMTLPVTHKSKRVAQSAGQDEDRPWHILPVNNKRSLPIDDEPAGMMTLPIIHAEKPGLVGRAVEVQLENRSDVAYYAQLRFGTPPQEVYAQIDTGSFELWVNPDCNQVRVPDQKFCRGIGTYRSDASSTFNPTSKTASLKYGIGSADIEYVRDNIALPGSASMRNVQFGVARSSKDQFSGILGIGYGEGINTNYKNFIDELDAQGVTKTKAFSLALGSKVEGQGVIVFGGVDTGKFQGKLAQLPIIPAKQSPDGVARYWVSLKSISHSAPGAESKPWANTEMTVFLDSGATLTLLPPDVTESIARELGSTQQGSDGFWDLDCGMINQKGSVDFEFNGVTIKVPYKEIVREIKILPTRCYLGVMPSSQFALLGDTFLRSAYAVFDLSANMAYLAQYANCGTNLRTITASSDLTNLSGSCSSGEDGGAEPPSISSVNSKPIPTTSVKIAPDSPKTTVSVPTTALLVDTGVPTTIPKPKATNVGPNGGASGVAGSNAGPQDEGSAGVRRGVNLRHLGVVAMMTGLISWVL